MARITNLPTEILHSILVTVCRLYAGAGNPILVQSGGQCGWAVQRALRLKLVCKRFLELLQPALFASRILDYFADGDRRMAAWPVTTYRYGLDRFWHDYLAYRIRNERHSMVGRFVDVRRIAEAFCAETGTELATCIDGLAWLVLDRAAGAPGNNANWQRPKLGINFYYFPGGKSSFGNTELSFDLNINLLSTAAYFNHFPLARRLLAEGYCLARPDELLPSPTQSAAFAGNAEMLMLLQEHLPHAQKVHTTSVTGAVLRGDLEMVKLALYPPSRADPKSTDILGETYGNIDPRSTKPTNAGRIISAVLCMTRDWDIYQYLLSAFTKPPRDYRTDVLLSTHIYRGNTNMVQKLVLEGGYGDQMQRFGTQHLKDTIRYCYDDIVDFILDFGISPNGDSRSSYKDGWTEIGSSDNPLAAAASAGSLSLMKKLVARGARVDESHISGWQKAFCNALAREHLDMARFLLTLWAPSRRWKKRLLSKYTRWQLVHRIEELESIPKFLLEVWGEEGWIRPSQVQIIRRDQQPAMMEHVCVSCLVGSTLGPCANCSYCTSLPIAQEPSASDSKREPLSPISYHNQRGMASHLFFPPSFPLSKTLNLRCARGTVSDFMRHSGCLIFWRLRRRLPRILCGLWPVESS